MWLRCGHLDLVLNTAAFADSMLNVATADCAHVRCRDAHTGSGGLRHFRHGALIISFMQLGRLPHFAKIFKARSQYFVAYSLLRLSDTWTYQIKFDSTTIEK